MIKSLQSWRFFFALLIFLHHSAWNLPAFGSFPVSFFLILSGFVLMKSWGDRISTMTFKSFFSRRFLRIYPTYLLCLVFALIVSICIARPIDWIKTIPSFVMLQAWFPEKAIYFGGNSVSWYVSVIVFCYAVFPFLARVLKKMPDLVFIPVCLYLCACLVIPKSCQHAFLYISPLFRSVDFILGMWLYECIENGRLREVKKSIVGLRTSLKLILEAGAFFICLLAIVLSLRFENAFTLAAFWWCPSLLIIAVFYIMDGDPGPLTRLLQNKVFVLLGAISYAFYLLHISILGINNYLMDIHPINYVVDGVLVLSVTIVLAYIVTYYFEPLFKKNSC